MNVMQFKLSILLFFLLILVISDVQANTKLNGWDITRHSHFAGIEEFSITNDYVLIENKYLHAIFSANSNIVTVFNKSTKKYVNVPINELFDSIFATKNCQDIRKPDKWLKKRIYTQNNLTLVEFIGEKTKVVVTTVENIHVAKNFTEFYQKAFSFPTNSFPYKIEIPNTLKQKNNTLSTYACYTTQIKHVNFSPDKFKIPKSYKKVKTIGSIYINDDLEDFTKSLN